MAVGRRGNGPRVTVDDGTELIPIQEINAAYDRMTKNDVRYRFVIDLKSLG